MSNGNAPTHLTNIKDARTYIGKLERNNAALRHDLERCMARELALLNSQSNGSGGSKVCEHGAWRWERCAECSQGESNE